MKCKDTGQMTMQLGPSVVNTPTLKHDWHFLLVDDKVRLKEDAENDPGDLWGEKKQSVRTVGVRHWRRNRADQVGSGNGDEHQWKDGHLEPWQFRITVETTRGPPAPNALNIFLGQLQQIASEYSDD